MCLQGSACRAVFKHANLMAEQKACMVVSGGAFALKLPRALRLFCVAFLPFGAVVKSHSEIPSPRGAAGEIRGEVGSVPLGVCYTKRLAGKLQGLVQVHGCDHPSSYFGEVLLSKSFCSSSSDASPNVSLTCCSQDSAGSALCVPLAQPWGSLQAPHPKPLPPAAHI